MATIKECDRCGYQQRKEADYNKVFPVSVEFNSDRIINDNNNCIVKDFCTNCIDELKRFMNERLPTNDER
ncbi:MAG: hypothetical protein WC346_11300 [Methanogenium sp.]|jgi:hypothetical protein